MTNAARRVLEAGVTAGVFPAAAIEVGTATEVLWSDAVGRLTFDSGSPATGPDTIFDLASLTKVLATATLTMQQIERGLLALDDPVATYVADWQRADRRAVTIRDLLSHCSGLPGHRPYYARLTGRRAFQLAICEEPLEYAPGSAAVYSDLGFMLLGFILAPEEDLSRRMAALLATMNVVEPLEFGVLPALRQRVAPTSRDPWRGRLLVGEVDDDNASALGGIAGHAGLFGTAGAVGACARHILQVLDNRRGAFTRETLDVFVTRRAGVPGSSRALGWDTMLPTSSCGTRMSPRAFGHTGFTGTSLWIDPDRGLYVVLLTNRVYPDRQDRGIQEVRRAVHDAVMDTLPAM